MSAALALCLAAAVFAQDESASDAASSMPVGRIIPAVASTPGSGGSFFKTSVQLYNPFTSTFYGRLVFHRAGTEGTSNDPGLDFSIPPLGTQSYEDVVDAMGLTGLGTLDVLAPSASSSPVVVARVFDDAGAAGTSGFSDDAINPNETGTAGRVLTPGHSGYLLIPSDLDAFRFNLGIRMISFGSRIQFVVRNAAGAQVADVSRVVNASSFLQQEASSYLGVELPPGGTIKVVLTTGSAIIYGATVDNTTQDPSIQYARAN